MLTELLIFSVTVKVSPGLTVWLEVDTLMVAGAVADIGIAINQNELKRSKKVPARAIIFLFILSGSIHRSFIPSDAQLSFQCVASVCLNFSRLFINI